MRASDIINQLAIYLPALVDDFTTQLSISSLVLAGSTVTATTATAHGLIVGNQVNITGAQTPIVISSINRVGIVATMVTATDHDMTENAGFDVQIFGATEAEFNGTFKLLSVPNRRTITFQVADSGALAATGSPLLLNGSNTFDSYNGLRDISAAPTATTFEYELTTTGLYSPASGVIIGKTLPRVSGAVDFDQLIRSYTKQPVDNAWLFVVIGDSIASKNRNIDIDATDNIQNGSFFNQRIIQTVDLFVFLPTVDEISGRQARDRCEELLRPICQSILAKRFPSLVEGTNNPLMLVRHGTQAYSTAFYAHQYTFEAVLTLGPDDIFTPTDDVAFRDVDLDMGLDIGSGTIDSEIDLDDEPL